MTHPGHPAPLEIAVLPGDGIGVDVAAEAVKVLRAVEANGGFHLHFTEYPAGADCYRQHGADLP